MVALGMKVEIDCVDYGPKPLRLKRNVPVAQGKRIGLIVIYLGGGSGMGSESTPWFSGRQE